MRRDDIAFVAKTVNPPAAHCYSLHYKLRELILTEESAESDVNVNEAVTNTSFRQSRQHDNADNIYDGENNEWTLRYSLHQGLRCELCIRRVCGKDNSDSS